MKLLKKSVTMLCIIALVCSLAATCFAADIGDTYPPHAVICCKYRLLNACERKSSVRPWN